MNVASRLTPNSLMGWGVLTIGLVAMADIPGLGDIAAALAWLLFFTLALVEGEKALSGIAGLYTKPGGNTSVVYKPASPSPSNTNAGGNPVA